jgi:hypothetical protein
MVNISLAESTDVRVLHIMDKYICLFAALNTDSTNYITHRSPSPVSEIREIT